METLDESAWNPGGWLGRCWGDDRCRFIGNRMGTGVNNSRGSRLGRSCGDRAAMQNKLAAARQFYLFQRLLIAASRLALLFKESATDLHR